MVRLTLRLDPHAVGLHVEHGHDPLARGCRQRSGRRPGRVHGLLVRHDARGHLLQQAPGGTATDHARRRRFHPARCGAERHLGGPVHQQRGERGRGHLPRRPAEMLVQQEVGRAIGRGVQAPAHPHVPKARHQRALAPPLDHVATRALRVQLALQHLQADHRHLAGGAAGFPKAPFLPVRARHLRPGLLRRWFSR